MARGYWMLTLLHTEMSPSSTQRLHSCSDLGLRAKPTTFPETSRALGGGGGGRRLYKAIFVKSNMKIRGRNLGLLAHLQGRAGWCTWAARPVPGIDAEHCRSTGCSRAPPSGTVRALCHPPSRAQPSPGIHQFPALHISVLGKQSCLKGL